MKFEFPVAYEFVGPMAQNSKALSFNTGGWLFPGDCLSTSVKAWPASVGRFLLVKTARLVLAWHYDTAGTKIRLVNAASGPSDIQNLCPWVDPSASGQNMGTPIVSSTVDLAVALNALSDGGVWRQLGIQVAGQGVINRATLEVIWEIEVQTEDEIKALIEDSTSPLIARIEALEAIQP